MTPLLQLYRKQFEAAVDTESKRMSKFHVYAATAAIRGIKCDRQLLIFIHALRFLFLVAGECYPVSAAE
jgi:hypothetical protein